jgi:hypothetical protein
LPVPVQDEKDSCPKCDVPGSGGSYTGTEPLRLVYTYVVVLAVLCGGVLILFDGITDRLIPLYVVDAASRKEKAELSESGPLAMGL